MPPGLSQPAKPDRQVGILATSKARGRCGINTSALSRRLSWVIQFTSIIPSSLACSLASLNRRSTTSKRRASTTVCLCLVPLLCSLSSTKPKHHHNHARQHHLLLQALHPQAQAGRRQVRRRMRLLRLRGGVLVRRPIDALHDDACLNDQRPTTNDHVGMADERTGAVLFLRFSFLSGSGEGAEG
ncbi:hypothetical protein IWX46DRAFT_386396 [Phyllosticta citricarpa]|uniref:Uncharacterized protein n=1 Tax=Phyllosticta citricarpa TaxID=55181 RepID=A0ABR1MJZ2_9PEZI